MFNFNTFVDGVREIYTFWGFSPNWFEWFSLFVSILSMYVAFKLGERGYNRDRDNKKKDEIELRKSELKLFKNNLEQLLKSIKKQQAALKKYAQEKGSSFEFYSNVQVDFLKFISQKHVYEYFGYKDSAKLDVINSLFTSLYSMNDFRNSLRDSIRNFILRHSDFEKGFYLYRKLLYKMMQEIANRRAIDMIPAQGGMSINFGNNEFVRKFYLLNQAALNNPILLDSSNNVIRPKMIELFILPAIELCKPFIPADHDAIQVSDVANEVNSSWINMKLLSDIHFKEIEGHIDTLECVKEKINEFLELKKD